MVDVFAIREQPSRLAPHAYRLLGIPISPTGSLKWIGFARSLSRRQQWSGAPSDQGKYRQKCRREQIGMFRVFSLKLNLNLAESNTDSWLAMTSRRA